MKAKKVISYTLTLFVMVSLVYVVFKKIPESPELSAVMSGSFDQENTVALDSISDEALAARKDVDIVYYFYTNVRCASCMKIENNTKRIVANQFSDMLEDGTIVWKMINTDEPGNHHYIDKYQLYTKSVVLVKIRNGEEVSWKNLDRVWRLLNDDDEYREYITGEIRSFSEGQ
ncbi:nitrophenyl compound nitroreductase subunit ArsF family protein [candidate division KSB1 bacterium]